MTKAKLRTIFNFIIAINIICYMCLIWVIEINAIGIGSITYWILIFIIIVLRDFIAPKQKRSDKHGNN